MTRQKILIVDDDPNFVLLAKSRLEANQYEVFAAMTSVDAIRMATELKPDLILLDMIMPAMEGYDICKKIKTDEQTRHIPILIVTASTKKENQLKCLSAGALVVILKPFLPSELLALIKKALDPKSKWRKTENMRHS